MEAREKEVTMVKEFPDLSSFVSSDVFPCCLIHHFSDCFINRKLQQWI